MQFNPMDWSAESWAVIVAIVALLRPEITKFLVNRRRSVKIQIRLPMELGFSNFGPTMSLVYSVIASGNKRTFVKCETKITRVSDNAQFIYESFFEKSTNPMQSTELSIQQTKYWVPFSVDHDFAATFHTFFVNQDQMAKIQKDMVELKANWQVYLRQITDQPAMYSKEMREVFRQYLSERSASDFWRRNRDRLLSVWMAGEYCLEIIFIDSQNNKEFGGRLKFFINEQNQDLLEANITGIQIAAAEDIFQNPQYGFFSVNLVP